MGCRTAIIGLLALLVLPAALSATLSAPALAGAWPRGEGQQFIALSYRLRHADDALHSSFAYYHELGVTADTTLVLDIGQSVSGAFKAVVALRYPLLQQPEGHKIAWDIGLGQIGGAATLRAGLAYGRGFRWARGFGWLAVDAAAFSAADLDGAHLQLDVTYGLSIGDGPKVYAQVLSGKPHNHDTDGFAWVGAATAIPLKPGLRLDLGLYHEVVSGDEYRLKIGVWHEF